MRIKVTDQNVNVVILDKGKSNNTTEKTQDVRW